jgi:hypothetical protein
MSNAHGFLSSSNSSDRSREKITRRSKEDRHLSHVASDAIHAGLAQGGEIIEILFSLFAIVFELNLNW